MGVRPVQPATAPTTAPAPGISRGRSPVPTLSAASIFVAMKRQRGFCSSWRRTQLGQCSSRDPVPAKFLISYLQLQRGARDLGVGQPRVITHHHRPHPRAVAHRRARPTQRLPVSEGRRIEARRLLVTFALWELCCCLFHLLARLLCLETSRVGAESIWARLFRGWLLQPFLQ